jgi:hypothetical protein
MPDWMVAIAALQAASTDGNGQTPPANHQTNPPKPKVPADGQFAEMDAALLHSAQIKPCVDLLVFQRLKNAASKRGWSIGKPEQHKSHQFGGEKLMIGEEVQQSPAFLGSFKPVQAWKIGFAGVLRFEFQVCGASGESGSCECGTGLMVGYAFRALKLFLQCRREQNAFGKFTQFHRECGILPPARVRPLFRGFGQRLCAIVIVPAETSTPRTTPRA